MKGSVKGADFLADFCVRHNIPMFEAFTEEDFNRILSFSALEAFADANEQLKGGEPLGDLAINLVIAITSDPFVVRPDD
jgi:hypothetical protein